MKTSFSRSFLSFAVLFLVALLLIGFSFQILVRSFLTNRAMEALRQDGESIAALVQAYSDDRDLDTRDFHIALSAAAAVSGADVVVCDASGMIRLCADAPFGCIHVGWRVDENFLKRTIQNDGAAYTGTISRLYPDQRFVLSLPVRSDAGTIVGILIISTPTAATQTVLQRISRIFITVSLLVLVAAVVFLTIFTRRNTAPLRTLAKAATDFGHGQLSARVNVEENASQEIRELALAFNNMASSLEKSEYQRQEFVANISHELKTPMTTISGFVDGILDGTIPEERHGQYLSLVSGETKRLSRLVRSMLDISRLQDRGFPPEQRSRFDLTECCGRVLITFEQSITQKNLDVQVQMPEHPVYTSANEDAITQVMYNLVDNAVKFSPQAGLLSLSIQEGGNKVYVSVQNDGPTIPPEELPLVFDRFHKMDKSRSRDRESWGLGLYIVKTIIGLHGEDISVTSIDGKTEFTFTLPLEN